MIDRLQYITQGSSINDHIEMCKLACESGVKWVQLRLKNVSNEEYLAAANTCREITNGHQAQLIINDNLEVALECKADGVHLGLSDLNTGAARSRVPENFIIGGTANSFEQIQSHCQNGVNYVGVGPFRFTTTKDKLSPILGTKGYQEILRQMQLSETKIPLIAIGGINESDVNELMQTGVHGIAVSGLISHASDKKELVTELYKKLNYATA